MRSDKELGTVAVWVALSMIPILAFMAVVADVGMLYWEKGQLQNGADAAALAVAQECAAEPASCSGIAGGVATEMAGFNANDDQANAAIAHLEVNGRAGKVTVESSTLNSEGVTVAHPFASLIVPGATTVDADATAEWGQPVAGNTLALAIDQCEFELSPPEEGDLIMLRYDQNAQNASACQDARGGFGWLESANCRADISVDGWVGVTTGNNPGGSGCTENYIMSLIGTTVVVPIFDAYRGTGDNTEYHIVAFAALELLDYRISGDDRVELPPGCSGQCRGIQARFVELVDFDDEFELGNGGDAGVTIVRLRLTE
ncbi:pilus assembly protein TadG-related protein [Agromyces sp. NDB4Y10]|uniref:pilus assembly protein TadG-related protein n=1 Tax=Agromyces sp. NDB4Y10 TaxID=1775951 RepID=UPI0018D494A2|nr:pilus assembly protein TadG-related protein [Agromyces sp. NDB4Y10]